MPDEANGREQCETTTEASRVIATAMHRDDVRDPGAPCGPAGIDRHRELMAVGERDSMPTEGAFQPPGARRRYGPLQVEVLDRDAGPFQLTGEPALAVGREKCHVPSPGGLQEIGRTSW